MLKTHIPIIGLVVGEISGDVLGARLMKVLRRYLPNVHFVGVAGPKMESEGIEIWYKMHEISVMGMIEILTKLPRILYIRHNLIHRFSKIKPDIFIGIDFPDFNIVIEKKLKNMGIPTIHYVSPSIWAWRKHRIFKINKATNNILVLFPFEKILYDKYNISCKFIGHTLADKIPLYPNKLQTRYELGINPDAHCLTLLPGSRKNEIKMLSKVFLKSAELLIKDFPQLEILVPLVDIDSIHQFKYINTHTMKLRILHNQSLKAMIASDVALVASGTAALECMLAKCPMVVAYRMNSLTFILTKILVDTPWIALPNLLAGKKLIPEFIQKSCHPKNLVSALTPFLKDIKYSLKLQDTFRKLHLQIRCHADEQAAQEVLRLLNI